jgi:hypothetical protein
VVTDALTYSAIVGNDWLSKVEANIDYKMATMTIKWHEKEIEIPVEYLEMPMDRRNRQEGLRKKIEEEIPELEEDTDEESESDYEEEYEEEEELEEKVFCHFEMFAPDEPPILETESDSEPPLQLSCTFQKVVLEGIYPREDFVLSNDGVYLGESFHHWNYFQRLEERYRMQPPKNARWVFDWKGPIARCWCQERLYSPSPNIVGCVKVI